MLMKNHTIFALCRPPPLLLMLHGSEPSEGGRRILHFFPLWKQTIIFGCIHFERTGIELLFHIFHYQLAVRTQLKMPCENGGFILVIFQEKINIEGMKKRYKYSGRVAVRFQTFPTVYDTWGVRECVAPAFQ